MHWLTVSVGRNWNTPRVPPRTEPPTQTRLPESEIAAAGSPPLVSSADQPISGGLPAQSGERRNPFQLPDVGRWQTQAAEGTVAMPTRTWNAPRRPLASSGGVSDQPVATTKEMLAEGTGAKPTRTWSAPKRPVPSSGAVPKGPEPTAGSADKDIGKTACVFHVSCDRTHEYASVRAH